MKKLLLTIAAFMFIGSLSAQNVARECVLFEIFTGVNCPYCPAAANAMTQMLDEGLAIAPVAVHTSAFSTEEYYTSETNARASFYGISSYPTLKADGIMGMSGGGNASQNLYNNYKPYYNNRMNVDSPFTIDLSYSILEGSTCQVTAVVNQVGDCSAGNLRVMIALTESHIQKSWQGMTELNAVTRDFIPTQGGTAFTGPTTTVTESFDMAGYPKENMNLVAWVQSFSTKEVFQTVILSMEPEETTYDVALREISSVVTKNCSNKVEPELTVKSFGTETVTSLEIEVSDEDDNVINTYNWTGEIAQGESETINIPEFDTQGASTLVFGVTKINGNDDVYSFDNYLSVNIEAAENYASQIYVQLKTPSDPEEMYLVLKNMTTGEVADEWHFDEGSHGYKFYIDVPTTDCYRLSVVNPTGNGNSGGFALIKDANGAMVMQFSNTINLYTYSYSVEFYCSNAGVEEDEAASAMVYPNPASGNIYIQGEGISNVMIYNSNGQLVYSNATVNDNLNVDSSAFENGLYVVKVTDVNGETYYKKIVVRQ